MASVVDICNLALGHLGDTATVASIDPPEGSAQAEHCARFYPIARDALLELHPWGFATKRVQLAPISTGWPEWDYSYAQPNDAVNIIAILPPGSMDDYSVSSSGKYLPQPFSCEIDDSGTNIILTDQVDAVLRYSAIVTDTTAFSPLFTMALSWHLASMLAGPLIKGDQGAAEAKRCGQLFQYYLSQATESDSSQRNVKPAHVVSWLAGR